MFALQVSGRGADLPDLSVLCLGKDRPRPRGLSEASLEESRLDTDILLDYDQ